MRLDHLEKHPEIHESVYVDPSARINGDVTIEAGASVWCSVSIRGDVHYIRIGPNTNIQDNCVLHTSHDVYPLNIGPGVVVGHGAILHGCAILGHSLIGMGAIILDDATVEEEVIIGAGTLVPQGKILKQGRLYLGSPAKEARELSADERKAVREGWKNYFDYVEEYRRQGKFFGWKDNPLNK
jgi:carbonic anhydrase/acetyltransferase-like protein (isoleucine patch superfamily)